MQHALCCVALVSALPSWQWQQKTKNKFSSIHNQTVVHFHWGEFTCVEFTTNVPKPSQTSHKFQKHSSSPRCCCKDIMRGVSIELEQTQIQLADHCMTMQLNRMTG
jgi:hypothetical protein